VRLRPGGGAFDQGKEIHSRTHKAKKTTTTKKIHGARQLQLDGKALEGESQQQEDNARSLTGKKSAGLNTGKHLRVTQVIKSSFNQTLNRGTWSFYLPDYATFGTVKTKPRYLTTADQDLRKKALKGEIPGRQGEKIRARTAGRGTLYLQTPQVLFWNMLDIYPKRVYTISFTVKLIAPPPPGADVLQVGGSFVAELYDDEGEYTTVHCKDHREIPLKKGAGAQKV
jgi:hypothetical protein